MCRRPLIFVVQERDVQVEQELEDEVLLCARVVQDRRQWAGAGLASEQGGREDHGERGGGHGGGGHDGVLDEDLQAAQLLTFSGLKMGNWNGNEEDGGRMGAHKLITNATMRRLRLGNLCTMSITLERHTSFLSNEDSARK